MAFLDRIRDGMEDVRMRISKQIQWTEGGLTRAGERNQLALGA